MSRTPFTKSELAAKRAECLEKLRATTKPGDRFYTVLTHRAASGMSRRVQVLRAVQGPDVVKSDLNGTVVHPGPMIIERVSWLVAHALGNRLDYDTHEVTLNGCGMDMGFELIYRLGAAIWPEGTPEPHSTRNGEPDRDGGYALNHEWI